MKFSRDSHALKWAALLVVIAAGFLWKGCNWQNPVDKHK
jgi:hypothetical protein